jgi:uncharacterized protein YndB with AHSA1/START domain
MDDKAKASALATNPTSVERVSDHELVVTRRFDVPVDRVFAAWTTAALFMQWWAPKSMGMALRACEMDVRPGGGYRLDFGPDEANPMVFFGTYTDVIPNARLVWTNDEDTAGAVTTVTFTADGDTTLLTYSERYPTQAGLEEAFEGSACAMPEQFEQLDALLATTG